MEVGMDEVAELWPALRRVRSLSFVARSDRPTGWNGSGSGAVAVASPAESVLTFSESGTWRSGNGRELAFRNVYRWSQVGPALVRMEHLRFGAGHPVYLFDLAP